MRNTPPVARVLSLGAGVQSSTLAIMAARGDIEPPDFSVFADTQAEPASVYRWLDELDAIVQASPHPFPILRVTQGDLGAKQLRVVVRARDEVPYVVVDIPAFGSKDGGVQIMGRQCTYQYKIVPVYRAIRKRLGWYRKRTPEGQWVEQWLGISTDEAVRMKPARVDWLKNAWPLIDADMSRADCHNYLDNIDLHPPRSACVFCPFRAPEEWLHLQVDEPAEFARAVQFERDLQSAVAQDRRSIQAVPYLSPDCIPLDQIDWAAKSADKTRWQLDLFGNECEGMCGI